ncbi:MAG: enoyl-CoA hydratase/isomerase family protein, partial [Myxococcales bacterium]|nr:enoyl-CoA hydratase/isomerase family protein [Deltaproteobacteria bacterium]MBT8483429.1 enoyl-CoA hydratase/isomerase family protein [Deltaproteobacteria bacterium]NNK43629.1 enoyl-CoA hydratase/isomerase family protein [Myxococcales bacterium]NNL26286.1 enoyl-CoA hydratase/isomerase family protein [Myxococcales bacterium]
VRRSASVATIELNDPPYNRLSMALIDALERTVDEVEQDASIRAVVLRGAGNENFSVGADIREFGAAAASQGVRSFIEQRLRVIRSIETMSKPIVCAIRGACLGGGLEIALACHFRIGARGSKIGLPEVELGVVPAWGGTQRLTRSVGRARALEMMLLAKKLDADEAFEAGLLTEACEPEDLDARVAELASELANKAPLAVAGILDAVIRGGPKSLEDGLLHEYAALERVMRSEDLQEGVLAFFQKRPPEFKGK